MPTISGFLDRYYAQSPWDNARAALLLFWSLVAIACFAYFPLGWLLVRLGWIEYFTYDSFKLGVAIFGVLSGITCWILALMPYKVFQEFVLCEFIFAFFWAGVGELFSGKYVFAWYWYAPFVLFILSGLVGIHILRSWKKELNVPSDYQGS